MAALLNILKIILIVCTFNMMWWAWNPLKLNMHIKQVNLWHINNTSMKLFRKKEERKSALKKDDVCQSHIGTN